MSRPETIVALSSGRPPAAIAVLRVSGIGALDAVRALAGALPEARRAGLRTLRGAQGEVLDRALVLAFPGPASATGEDLVELHLHGGRAVVEAVESALLAQPGLRRAEPGEFTRRALLNGRIDLAEAEGLADLLAAETETQRRAALRAAEGGLSRQVRAWLLALDGIAASIEADIDYAEEDDVAARVSATTAEELAGLADEMRALLARPPVERVRDGVRVVIAGPPNTGKSTLINALAGREVAIVSPVAGTTRDRIEAPVQRDGIAYLLADTAGLTETVDPVEAIGVRLARETAAAADVLVWTGDDAPPRESVWLLARADLPGREAAGDRLPVSVRTGQGIDALWALLDARAKALLPAEDDLWVNQRQRALVAEAEATLGETPALSDPLLVAEQVRVARRALARILGLDAGETLLDAVFSRFCLGK